jgi:hypothetical protein
MTALAALPAAEVLRRVLNQQAPQATEGVVALNDFGRLTDNAQTAAQPAINSALQQSKDQIHGGIVPPISPVCEFNWFTQ